MSKSSKRPAPTDDSDDDVGPMPAGAAGAVVVAAADDDDNGPMPAPAAGAAAARVTKPKKKKGEQAECMRSHRLCPPPPTAFSDCCIFVRFCCFLFDAPQWLNSKSCSWRICP